MSDAKRWRALAARLGVETSIVGAPMAGASTPRLVAAVSQAGGLGSLAAAYLPPEEIRAQAAEVRRLTDRPFAINLFAPLPPPPARDPAPMLALLEPLHRELGLPPPEPPRGPALPDFGAQVEAALACAPAAFSFTFGVPEAAVLEAFRKQGARLLGTATTVREARLLEEAGVDAVVAQGAEAGGHRGSFASPFEAALVGTMALVPQVADAVRLPVLASGGIMDGRGVAAARLLGASGVQVGTAFLCCPESGAPAAHQAAVLSASDEGTRLIAAFSGRPARGLANAFSEALAGRAEVLPFPVQHGLMRPLRQEAARRGDARYLALWAGQGAPLARRRGAAEVVRAMREEAEALLRAEAD